MPRKLTTWIGSLVILAAGVFSFVSLFQARAKFLPEGTNFQLATVGIFLVPLVAIVAISLWYYFNEKH